MLKILKWLLVVVAAVLVMALAAVWIGGGVNFNQQAPYQLYKSWGSEGSEPGQFRDPTGIAVTATEVFVSDARNSRIQVFDKQGNFRRQFGQEQLGRPMNLTIHEERLYVPDYFNDVIHIYSIAGAHQQSIQAKGGLNSPGGVAVYPDGSLLVADTYNQRVVRIDTDGNLINRWGDNPAAGDDAIDFNYPTDVAITHKPQPDSARQQGKAFVVADGYNDRIQQIAANGELVRRWGGPFGLNIFGPFKGWFATVSSISTAPDGSIFVADFYNDRIQKFSRDGDFQTAFGTPSTGPGYTEIAVTADTDGSVWSVNFTDRKVEHWRPAPNK